MLGQGKFPISKRVTQQAPSPLTQIFELRDSYLRSERKLDLIDASQGVPSYPPPKSIQRVLQKAALQSESYSYTDRQGIFELRDAICKDFKVKSGFELSTNEVLITSGCNAAFCVAVTALLENEDEVIVPRPYYFNHPMWIEMIGGKVVDVPLDVGGELNVSNIIDAITPKTRAVIVVSPGNPMGASAPKQQLEMLAQKLGHRGIFLILDETYRAFSESLECPFSCASFSDFPNLVRLLSFSKELAIPGLRVGAVCANSEIIPEMLKVHDCFSICTPKIGQLATIEGLLDQSPWKKEKILAIAEKRETFRDAMHKAPRGFKMEACGGFFSWLKHPIDGMFSWDVSRKLVTEIGILTLPGSLFGPGQESYLRIGLAGLSLAEIEEFPKRIECLEL